MARDPEQDEDQGRNASAIPSPLLRRATATVSFERLWPWIVAALVTVSVFVTLSFATKVKRMQLVTSTRTTRSSSSEGISGCSFIGTATNM